MVLISGFVQPLLCEETVLDPVDVPRMTKEELKAKLDNPDLVIIDARSAHDWEDSETKIKGLFVRMRVKSPPGSTSIPRTNDCSLLQVMQEATSARAALQLINQGYKNVYALKGGWAEWESEKYPVEPKELNSNGTCSQDECASASFLSQERWGRY